MQELINTFFSVIPVIPAGSKHRIEELNKHRLIHFELL
jgi:hypothetical protein